MENIINNKTNQQTSNWKIILNTILVLLETTVLLSLSIAIPLLLIKPAYGLIINYESWSLINTLSNVFTGITLVAFAIMLYVSWRLFAKKSFIAWVGASILMTMVVLTMFFAI